MNTDRLRTILYEASVIFLCGVAIASVVSFVWNTKFKLTIDRFKSEYSKGMSDDQLMLAEKYLRKFPASDLIAAVEEQNIDGTCHIQAHPIGRAVYKQNQNFTDAIRVCGNSCTFGCFHGVLMQMFATDSDTLGGVVDEESPEAYLAHVKAIAKDLCSKPEVENLIQRRTCYHGIGHVFESMANNDLDDGLSSCNVFDEPRAKEACVTGVFMEHLFSASSTDIRITKGPEPCDAYPQYTRECYIYKAYGWVSAWGGAQPAFDACQSFGENTNLCIMNVARAAANEPMLGSWRGFEQLCGRFDGHEKSECIRGALMKIIYLNDGDDSDHACDRVSTLYRPSCIKVLHAYLAENG